MKGSSLRIQPIAPELKKAKRLSFEKISEPL
jgi:hypothetical protein